MVDIPRNQTKQTKPLQISVERELYIFNLSPIYTWQRLVGLKRVSIYQICYTWILESGIRQGRQLTCLRYILFCQKVRFTIKLTSTETMGKVLMLVKIAWICIKIMKVLNPSLPVIYSIVSFLGKNVQMTCNNG